MRTATGEYPWMLSQHLARKAGDRNPVVFILQSLQIFDNCAPNQSFGCFTWPARLASNTEHSSYGISDGRLVASGKDHGGCAVVWNVCTSGVFYAASVPLD